MTRYTLEITPSLIMIVETDGSGGGEISSPLPAELGFAGDAIDSLVLAHAADSVDISSPAYVEGIRTAVEAIANHLPDPEHGEE